jgi:hypothetical protein
MVSATLRKFENIAIAVAIINAIRLNHKASLRTAYFIENDSDKVKAIWFGYSNH